MAEVEKKEIRLSPDAVNKYTAAGVVAINAYNHVLNACIDGASILDICKSGDEFIKTSLESVLSKKKVQKSIAFPTCVSVNTAICHFSPIASDPATILKTGDIARIELGVQIDGYPALLSNTIVVGASKESKVSGKKANVILATHYAIEAALRVLKPGNTTADVANIIKKVASEYKCTAVQGMVSYQHEQNNLTAKKLILVNPGENQKPESFPVELGDVFSLDIMLSTNENPVPKRVENQRTTVFRRTEVVYGLKTSSARTIYSEVKKNFGSFPFSLRQFPDESKARMGLIECLKQGMFEPYDVCAEKEDEEVAHIIVTVLVTGSGALQVSEIPFDSELYTSEYSIQSLEIKEILEKPSREKKIKNKGAAAGESA